MSATINYDELEVGYDVPAVPGMKEADIQTPCLIVDLDSLERNVKKMGDLGQRKWVFGIAPMAKCTNLLMLPNCRKPLVRFGRRLLPESIRGRSLCSWWHQGRDDFQSGS